MIHLKRIFIICLSAFLISGCTSSSSTKKKSTTNKTSEKATTNKSDTEKKKTETTEQTSNPVLNTTSVTIKMGHTYQLKVSGNLSSDITWGSYNNSIAVVGDEGLIIPKSAGSTRITARVDNKTLTCYVTVTGTRTKKKKTSSTTTNKSNSSSTKKSTNETSPSNNETKTDENKAEENTNQDDEPKTYLVVTYHYKDENGNEVSQVVHTEEISSNFLISGLTAESAGTKWVNEHQDEVKALYGSDGTFNIQTRES